MKKKEKNILKKVFLFVWVFFLVIIFICFFTKAVKKSRDSERLANTKKLNGIVYNELLSWKSILDLQIKSKTNSGLTINWEVWEHFSTQWEFDYSFIKGKKDKYIDPLTRRPYPFSVAIWIEWWHPYFIQIATISEMKNRALLIWNYHKIKSNDSVSLYTNHAGFHVVNWLALLPY